jgi:hypothetical protein
MKGWAGGEERWGRKDLGDERMGRRGGKVGEEGLGDERMGRRGGKVVGVVGGLQLGE